MLLYNKQLTMSSFDVDTNDHEYFSSSVETITLGRDLVTSLAVEPPHSFDIVWNMDLNEALTNIQAPYTIDATEETHKDGDLTNGKMYTLGTDTSTIEIELVRVLTGGNVTSLTYTYGTSSSTAVGTGVDEVTCMADLSKQLLTDGITVTVLLADGTQDVGSTLAILMNAAVSSGIGNSLDTQDSAIAAFMATLKGQAGAYNWYDYNADNAQSATTQVKNGLALLFDREPELNNLIGTAATSSSFLDSDKIKIKMQDSTDLFYSKLFSVEQMKEVLEAVADRGSRISGTGASRTFNFTAGDSITAVVKVVDSDSAGNSDRWLVTLQQS